MPRLGPEAIAIINELRAIKRLIDRPTTKLASIDTIIRDNFAVTAADELAVGTHGVFSSGSLLNEGSANLTVRIDYWTAGQARNLILQVGKRLTFNMAPILKIVFVDTGTVTLSLTTIQITDEDLIFAIVRSSIVLSDYLGARAVNSNFTRGIPVTGIALRSGAAESALASVSNIGADADALTTALPAHLWKWNETNYDRERNNARTTVFASAARTTTTNSADQTNYNHKGGRLFLDVTAVSGTAPTLDVTLQTRDSISGTYIAIPGAAFAQKTAISFDDLTVYPGIAETANETVSDIVSRIWRAVATIGGTTPSFTFSLSIDGVL